MAQAKHLLRAAQEATTLRLYDHRASTVGVQLYIKREDLLHPHASGNKWRKLKYHLLAARSAGHNTLLTFGGAHSNHIYAVAAAGQEAGFGTIGIIRGELPEPLNPTLAFAQASGMKLVAIDRSTYRQKASATVMQALQNEYGPCYIIPEGGSGPLAVKGVAELVQEYPRHYDYTFCPAGTGGTAAGLVAGQQGQGHVMVVSALKGGAFLEDGVQAMLATAQAPGWQNWQVLTQHHCGGYARINEALVSTVQGFWQEHGIKLDPVYTGKMALAFYDLLEKGHFAPGSHVLLIHTGGLQGVAGMEKRYGVVFHPGTEGA